MQFLEVAFLRSDILLGYPLGESLGLQASTIFYICLFNFFQL
jgi:hypothetical protein